MLGMLISPPLGAIARGAQRGDGASAPAGSGTHCHYTVARRLKQVSLSSPLPLFFFFYHLGGFYHNKASMSLQSVKRITSPPPHTHRHTHLRTHPH